MVIDILLFVSNRFTTPRNESNKKEIFSKSPETIRHHFGRKTMEVTGLEPACRIFHTLYAEKSVLWTFANRATFFKIKVAIEHSRQVTKSGISPLCYTPPYGFGTIFAE